MDHIAVRINRLWEAMHLVAGRTTNLKDCREKCKVRLHKTNMTHQRPHHILAWSTPCSITLIITSTKRQLHGDRLYWWFTRCSPTHFERSIHHSQGRQSHPSPSYFVWSKDTCLIDHHGNQGHCIIVVMTTNYGALCISHWHRLPSAVDGNYVQFSRDTRLSWLDSLFTNYGRSWCHK